MRKILFLNNVLRINLRFFAKDFSYFAFRILEFFFEISTLILANKFRLNTKNKD